MVQQSRDKTKEEKDWVVPAAIVIGGAGIAGGIYLALKKPKGVDQGDTIIAKFSFDYGLEAGTFIMQISLGTILEGNWFDHIEGLTFTGEMQLEGPGNYTKEFEFTLPDSVEPKIYDAEAIIRKPSMSTYDYLIKSLGRGVLNVRKS